MKWLHHCSFSGFVPLVKAGLRSLWLQLLSLLSFLAPANLKAQLAKAKQKTPVEIAVGVVKGILYSGVYSVWLAYYFIRYDNVVKRILRFK